MKFSRYSKLGVITAMLVLGACGQPQDAENQGAADQEAANQQSGTQLDMSKGPNKVTSDDYALQPVASGEVPLVSVDADGNIAPFGMASRAPREVAIVAEVVADATAPAAYTANCVACHGADAKGIQGLGLDLTTSELVSTSSVAELVGFLKAGRMPTDPASVTGIPMPGFAWMADTDLEVVAAYLKTL
jgi:mono/diheme cytochrome c family protein